MRFYHGKFLNTPSKARGFFAQIGALFISITEYDS